MGKLVQGIGINDNTYPTQKDLVLCDEYQQWSGMLFRCTQKYWNNKPTYIGTTCSENFKNYSFFYEWCNKQTGFGNKDEDGKVWCLDKDILIKGNKTYGENACVFVPPRVNTLLIKADKVRGDYPIGVSREKTSGKFKACCFFRDVNKHLGRYTTPLEAFMVYKTYKEALIKDVANQYKTQLDPRAYQALMNYEVEITD